MKNTNKLDKLYQLARRARQTEDSEAARSYYDAILVEDPDSWEATLFSAYYRTNDAKLSDIYNLAVHMLKSLNIIMEQIEDGVDGFDETFEAVNIVYNVCYHFSDLLYTEARRNWDMQLRNHTENTPFNVIENHQYEFTNNCYVLVNIMYRLGNLIESDYLGIYTLANIGDASESPYAPLAINAWHKGIELHTDFLNSYREKEDKEKGKSEILSYVSKIQKYDSSYTTPEIKITGCYIATAVYGSYDCPEVWTLRRFRDDILQKMWCGEAFICTYYKISPVLVKHFGHISCVNKIWKKILNCFVRKLNRTGIKDTPYKD